jgi:dihydrofolate reductase
MADVDPKALAASIGSTRSTLAGVWQLNEADQGSGVPYTPSTSEAPAVRPGYGDREMSKSQYYCAATLDGYIAEADDSLAWLLGYEGSYEGEGAEPGPMSEGGSYGRFYEGVGALVSGSVTYEFVLDHMDDPSSWPYGDKPYWVLSSRELRVPEGEGIDVRVADAGVADLHEEMLAAAGGRNLWVVGGGNVASQFADEGLLDEVLLTVVPVVLGAGKPLFDRRLPGGPLQLTGTSVFETGMVELRYEVRGAIAES